MESDNISPSLQDIIFKATSLTPDLINLEYGNKKTHLKSAKKGLRELKVIVAALDKRIRNEVTEEVSLHADNNKHKYTANADNLDRLRGRKSNN